MCVTLVAHGPTDVEVGKFGMSLGDAKNVFTAICDKLGLEIESHSVYRGVVFEIHQDDADRLKALLYQVAYVDNWRSSAPISYTMYEEIVPENGYLKTGIYDTFSLRRPRI